MHPSRDTAGPLSPLYPGSLRPVAEPRQVIRANGFQTGGLQAHAWASGQFCLRAWIIVQNTSFLCPLVQRDGVDDAAAAVVLLLLPPVGMWSLTAPLRICAYFHSAAQANRQKGEREGKKVRAEREMWGGKGE